MQAMVSRLQLQSCYCLDDVGLVSGALVHWHWQYKARFDRLLLRLLLLLPLLLLLMKFLENVHISSSF